MKKNILTIIIFCLTTLILSSCYGLHQTGTNGTHDFNGLEAIEFCISLYAFFTLMVYIFGASDSYKTTEHEITSNGHTTRYTHTDYSQVSSYGTHEKGINNIVFLNYIFLFVIQVCVLEFIAHVTFSPKRLIWHVLIIAIVIIDMFFMHKTWKNEINTIFKYIAYISWGLLSIDIIVGILYYLCTN